LAGYIRYKHKFNITKDEKYDVYENKFTTFKLILYKSKMPTNNVTKSN